MTDDDIDIDLVDSSYDNTTNIDHSNINNNINDSNTIITEITSLNQSQIIDNRSTQNVPDLLKNVTKNNNNDESAYLDYNCLDPDIENNFNTKDIIGDFNKEIEDEIKLLLNYNINIQDDLEELRKDIKDTLARPIESTINNISEVVNHVIKKLVKTQSISEENNKYSSNTDNYEIIEEDSKINMDNESNSRKEMNISRPTFLLLDNNIDNKIYDAFLSDGKDEINISEEYDTEQITNNVETTIKQLSTELRKIIPKLDELREQDKFWCEHKIDNSKTTDSNLNDIPRMAKNIKLSSPTTTESSACSTKINDVNHIIRRSNAKHKT